MPSRATNSGEIIYQIYPKSFLDTNGDGIGDLNGVLAKLDYIKELGVTAIWLNPIFESPHVDNGYDVSDYYTVDPQYGGMQVVEKIIDEAHKKGLKVLFDLVLNHTSSSHKWFQEALKGLNNPYRDYYIWQKSLDEYGCPNNWQSFFGGSVWEKDPKSDEHYFHLFHKKMPDLNWKNKDVRDEMVKVAKFWLNKGVDGFRLDAFIHLAKAEGFPFATYAEPNELIIAEEFFANLPEVDEYLREFAASIREDFPEVYLLGEAASASPERAVDYMSPKGKACDSVVSFRYFPMDTLNVDPRIPKKLQEGHLDIYQFKRIMGEWQRKVGSVRELTLYLNNHDMPRAVSRFGDIKDFRNESSKTLATMMYLQRGVPVLLNGEEIGMKNLELTRWEGTRIDSIHKIYEELIENGLTKEEAKDFLASKSINSSRGAMQWTDELFAGFSTTEPWSGVNNEAKYNVKAQEQSEESILTYYKQLLRLKKSDLFTYGSYEMLITPKDCISYRREYRGTQAVVLCNFAKEQRDVTLSSIDEYEMERILEVGDVVQKQNHFQLSPFSSIVLKTK